jgi:hypothetical protein
MNERACMGNTETPLGSQCLWIVAPCGVERKGRCDRDECPTMMRRWTVLIPTMTKILRVGGAWQWGVNWVQVGTRTNRKLPTCPHAGSRL